MPQFLSCIFLFLLFQYSQASCSSTNSDLTATYSINGPIDPGSNCTIQLNYSNDIFARITVDVKNLKTTDRIIFDHGNIFSAIEVDSNTTMTFSLPPPYTNIRILSSQDSTLELNITVTPQNFNPFIMRGGSATTAENMYETYWELKSMNQMTFYMAVCPTGSKSAFAVAYPSLDPTTPSYQLSNIFVYDGNQNGATLLGTLFDYKTGTFTAATTASLTFYVASPVQMDGVIMIADKTSYAAFSRYNVVWAQAFNNGYQSYELVSDRDKAAVTIVNAPSSGNGGIYLTGVNNLQNNPSVLAYYHGPISNQSTMALLMNYGIANTLPQHFEGISRTFIINGTSRATLTWTTDVATTKQTLGYDGRFGFIATPSYPLVSSDTDSVGINLISPTNDPIYVDLWYNDCQQINAVTVVTNLDTGILVYDVCSIYTFNQNVPFSGRNLQVTVHDNSTTSRGTFLYYQVSTTANAPTNPSVTTKSPNSGTGTTKTPGGAGSSLLTGIQLVLLSTVLLFRC